MTAFVYQWYDKIRDMYYIGAHKGHQNDSYICSSSIMMAQYYERKDDFQRTILSVHDSWAEARKEEIRLLESVDAQNNPQYYNCTNGIGPIPWEQLSEESKEKHRINVSRAHFGKTKKPFSHEHRINMSKVKKGRKKKPFSATARKNMSDAHKGIQFSSEHKDKISKANKGRQFSTAHREKLKQAWQKRKLAPCI